jgi:uncharacterized integral membrane protein (TIGR00698 family)
MAEESTRSAVEAEEPNSDIAFEVHERRPPKGPIRMVIPGLAVAVVAVAISIFINQLVPPMSALLVAIILGVILRNVVSLPEAVEPGLTFASKKLLRAGIVLLGFQVAVGDILGLGAGMIIVVVAIVGLGIIVSLIFGKLFNMTPTQALLIGCGFSICGAAAVAAVDGVIDDKEKEQETVTAVALVVLFGTLMIPIIPVLGGLFGLSSDQTGVWAGSSVHEVAQVVAIGGTLSASALAVAVIVKLARVMLLAPVMATISVIRRRQAEHSGGKLPPIIPLFVAGFIVTVALRSTLPMPQWFLDSAELIQTVLLAAAMFALGTGVKLSMFRSVGFKPFALGAVVTVFVAILGFGGAALFA